MASNYSITLSSLLFLVIMFTYSEADLGLPQKTEMTLFFQDYTGGPNRTVAQITGQRPNGLLNFTEFGAMFCTDDPITKEFNEGSAQVARGQGMYVTSALNGSRTHVLISIVFTNEKYNDSTLEIQGSSAQFKPVREVAVVGGTGKFRLARGYATFETVAYDPTRFYSVIRCNITVFHY